MASGRHSKEGLEFEMSSTAPTQQIETPNSLHNVFSRPPLGIENGIHFFSEMKNDEYSYANEKLISEPRLIEFIPKRKYELALEVGAGNGRCAEPLSSICEHLIALESSREGLNQLISRKLGNVTPVLSYELQLPFLSNTFDLVASITVIEHIPPDKSIEFLTEHYRVLKHKGLFLIRNDAWAYGFYERHIGFKNRDADPTHINMITPRSLQKQLEQVGFKVIDSAYFPFYRATKLKLPLMDILATKGNFLCIKT
jgi:SAM-dependent methyltransferase